MVQTPRMQRLLARLDRIRNQAEDRPDRQNPEYLRDVDAQLLKQRADQLARAATQTAIGNRDDATERFLLFSLGQDSYGLALPHVQSVRARPRVTKLAAAPAELEGITYHRGLILPVLNLTYLLSNKGMKTESSPASETTNLIVLEQGQTSLGLLVENIDGVVNSNLQHLNDMSLLLPRTAGQLFSGMTRERQIVLDVSRLTEVVKKAFLEEPVRS